MKINKRISRSPGTHSGVFRRLVILLVIAGMCAYISAFYYQLMLVQGDSMAPSYSSWQLLMIDKNPGTLERNDVIAFHSDGLKAVLLKRIVAVPGDTVDIQDGTLYINGEPEKASPSQETLPGDIGLPAVLGDGEYFVLGDNRSQSTDSRHSTVGIVQRDDILGVAVPNLIPA